MSKRQGFGTRSLQRSHMVNHGLPWRCDVAGCEYSETGFLSQRMQREHLDSFHTEGQSHLPVSHLDATENNDQEDITSILFDLVKADRGTEVKALLHHFKALKTPTQIQMLQFAAKSSSTSAMRILFNHWYGKNKRDALGVLVSAIQGKNLEAVEWLLRNTDTRLKGETSYPEYRDISKFTGTPELYSWTSRDAWSNILASVLESDCETLFQTLLPEFVVEFLTERNGANLEPPSSRSTLARSMSLVVIKATSRQPEREERLIMIWERISKNVTSKNFERTLRQALGYVVGLCCSVPMAKALLSYGAPVNYTTNNQSIGSFRTPLHKTLRKSRPETAEMARFLLYRGANPDFRALRCNVELIKDEIGAREISKWLGMTWDELVAKVKADLEAGICPPEYL